MKKVFSIRDRATASYGAPMCFVAKGEALRTFMDAINDPKNGNLSAHPEDFDLFYLGVFDEDKGTFACTAPEQVAVGKDCVTSTRGVDNVSK